MKCSLDKLIKRFKNLHVLSWFIIALTVLYIFISILFEFQDWLTLIYGLMLIPLMIGLKQTVQEEINKPYRFTINIIDGLMALIGVITTYTLSHQLGISAVIASSLVGLMGYFLAKKHAVAIYCGSFAGMVSSFLFGYGEVVLIGITCGILFMMFKPVMKGMGGKLGTTAFISTMLLASILQKDFLIIDHQLSFTWLLVVSFLGTTMTYYLQHLLKQSAVFASASVSLIFALILIYLVEDFLPYTIVFFSASFVGMSSKHRLPNLAFVLLAGLIHAFLYDIYFEHYNGLGGKLGLMAFTTMLITLGMQISYQWIASQINKKLRGNKQ